LLRERLLPVAVHYFVLSDYFVYIFDYFIYISDYFIYT
jgi:hypothetical protein